MLTAHLQHDMKQDEREREQEKLLLLRKIYRRVLNLAVNIQEIKIATRIKYSHERAFHACL